jgi:hypothetical protein
MKEPHMKGEYMGHASLLTKSVVRRQPFKKAVDGKKNIFFRGKIYETRWSCSIKTGKNNPD